MRNIKIIIEYDGTGYHGWQFQPGLRTIQGSLESSLSIMTKARTGVFGSGRTDSGVHALCQVANFKTESRMKSEEFKAAFKSLLPRDIVVKHVEEVDESFNARFDAVRRAYRYTILNGPTPSAFLHNYSYYFRKPINWETMAEGCKNLMGTHDFSSFALEGDPVSTRIRTVFDASIISVGQPSSCFPSLYLNNIPDGQMNMIYFYIEADGFLRGMVRAIAGTLLEIGRGNMNPEGIKEILKARDRRAAGPGLPSRGLCLVKVEYAS